MILFAKATCFILPRDVLLAFFRGRVPFIFNLNRIQIMPPQVGALDKKYIPQDELFH